VNYDEESKKRETQQGKKITKREKIVEKRNKIWGYM